MVQIVHIPWHLQIEIAHSVVIINQHIQIYQLIRVKVFYVILLDSEICNSFFLLITEYYQN
jgi:hypothetical protein